MSVINTNITSMIGQNNLNKSQNDLTTSMERLSSGLRINSAKDDAAGQAIANRFTAQITGLGQAQRNANDGISIAQTAEGGLNQVNDNLQRVRELTVQASNGTNSQSDLESIQNEINQRMDEINRISKETDFNGTRVLAEDSDLKIQVGADDGQTISVGLQQITSKTLGLDGFNVDGSGEVANRSATLSDITSQPGYDAAASTGDNYVVTESFDEVDLETLTSQLSSGDTITVGTGADATAYTYDAEADNFTFTEDSIDYTSLAQEHTPSAGQTNTGSYTYSDGSKADFTVDANGNLSIGEDAAYIDADGKLSSNDPSGTATQATLEGLLSTVGNNDQDAANRTVNIDGQSYGGQTDIADSYTTDITGFTGTVNTATESDTLVAGLTAAGVELVDGVTAGDASAALTSATDEASFVAAINSNFTGVSASLDSTDALAVTYDSGVTDADANTALDAFITTDTASANGALTQTYVATADATGFDGSSADTAAATTFVDAIESAGFATGTASTVANFEAATGPVALTAALTDIAGVTATNNAGEIELTFDPATVSAEQATALNEALGSLLGSSDSVSYNTANGVAFEETASTEAVLSAAADSTESTTVDMQMGINTSSVVFDAAAAGTVGDMSTAAANTQVYVDNDSELTTTASVTTTYNVDPNNAEVSVVSSDGEGKYAQEADAAVYINDKGSLTTAETSEGERTEDPLAALDAALAQVDGLRSDLGAIQNRFESAITNLSTNETNLSAARSRIEDADYATEVANMTRAQILQQAGTSVLAQANQIPQNVLSLLG